MSYIGSLLVAGCALLLFLCLERGDNVIVETKLGRAKGVILKSRDGVDFFAFRGIPYAHSPAGENRFKPAKTLEKWDGLLDATKDGPVCPQPYSFEKKYSKSQMSENCLSINVFSRNLTESRPVMFFIHGGAYIGGSGHSELSIGPQYLMDKDIVLVTFNYRLGALGFLSTGTKEFPGNFGLKDQNLALKWVRDNIREFGGDPDAITIAGHSAGAMAVTSHMASPMSKGLFKRAIAMSASATVHHFRDNQHYANKLATEAGCPINNPEEQVNCLRQVPWETILEVCNTWEPYNMKWNYEIEGDFGQERFLIEPVTDTFARGDFHKVPIMTGITRDEFTDAAHAMMMTPKLIDAINDNFEKWAPKLFMYNGQAPNALANSKKLKEFYLKNERITDRNVDKFGEILTDAIIVHSVHRLVQLARKYVDVYYYRTDYVGRYSRAVVDGKPLGLVAHADDLQYLFLCKVFAPEISASDPERIMLERYTKWWSSFTISGSPNEDTWLPCNKSNVSALYIDKELKLSEEPFKERVQLWDKLFPVSAGAET